GGRSTQRRAQGKYRESENVKRLPAVQVGDPAEYDHQSRDHQQIRGDDPFDHRQVGLEIARESWESNIDDARIQVGDERPQGDAKKGQPFSPPVVGSARHHSLPKNDAWQHRIILAVLYAQIPTSHLWRRTLPSNIGQVAVNVAGALLGYLRSR